MGKFDGIMIMSDYDGTLKSSKKEISKENREAIEYFEREGGIFCIASGRQGDFVANVGETLPLNGYSVVINGTVICEPDNSKNIVEVPLDREAMIKFAAKLEEACPLRTNFRFVSIDETYYVYPNERVEDALKDITCPIYKFLCITPTEQSDEYFALIKKLAGDDFYISRSWIHGLEIQPANTSKGDAIALLKKLYGGKIHTVIAVGDYENDIDMIKKADIGYAVANGVASLKEAADRITVSCDDHALAAIINEL